MCKNAEAPCPGCRKHQKADAAWMFLTEEERRAIENPGTVSPPVTAHS